MQTTTDVRDELRKAPQPADAMVRVSPAASTRSSQASDHTNVGRLERIVSSVLGGALMLPVLSKPSPLKGALALGGAALLHRGITGHCYVYQALERNTASPESRGVTPAHRSITIEKPAAELYRVWREPRRLAAILGDIAQVESLGETRMRWRLNLPGGRSHSWTTKIYEDVPDQRIAWRTEEDADIAHEGFVSFRPAPRDFGTEVTLSLGFGGLADKLFRKVTQGVEASVLRRFKASVVAGEIATLDKNPSARA